jgi:rhomboid-like protein
MFLLGLSALLNPEFKISVIFLPFYSFPIGYGTLAIASLDLLGIVMKWKTFDHFAHLGGLLYSLVFLEVMKKLYPKIK